jgi:hypothetical protein
VGEERHLRCRAERRKNRAEETHRDPIVGHTASA